MYRNCFITVKAFIGIEIVRHGRRQLLAHLVADTTVRVYDCGGRDFYRHVD